MGKAVTESDPGRWTAIIPAAGKGRRLGFHQPKILYPVLGKTVLEWLVGALSPSCARFVLVVSADGRDVVSTAATALLGERSECVVQVTPRGMADAVWAAHEFVRTDHSLVVWGDQVTISADTVRRCQALHEARPHATATFPVVHRERPYTVFERDGAGRLSAVLEAREGAPMPAFGANDCGLFAFDTHVLYSILAQAREEGRGIGARTGEQNLLPLLPAFERGPGSLETLLIDDGGQALGINSVTDGDEAARVLEFRNGGVER